MLDLCSSNETLRLCGTASTFIRQQRRRRRRRRSERKTDGYLPWKQPAVCWFYSGAVGPHSAAHGPKCEGKERLAFAPLLVHLHHHLISLMSWQVGVSTCSPLRWRHVQRAREASNGFTTTLIIEQSLRSLFKQTFKPLGCYTAS